MRGNQEGRHHQESELREPGAPGCGQGQHLQRPPHRVWPDPGKIPDPASVLDLGTHSSATVDYPDYAEAVATVLRDGQVDRGIIVCGSGAGVSIAANKFPGIRAAVCHDTYTAHQAVEHDDMNVLCLGSDDHVDERIPRPPYFRHMEQVNAKGGMGAPKSAARSDTLAAAASPPWTSTRVRNPYPQSAASVGG